MSVSGPSSQHDSNYSQIIQDQLYLDEQTRTKSDDENLYIDTGTVLPQEMSNFYSLNFPNLSAVSATECNIQSFTTISSGIAPEAELSINEDKGVNTPTRDLVLASISVMKGRKARPDTKRICNWVNRKYGRSVHEVVREIDELCKQAVLEKVDYKGSISFRITSEKRLHKRVGRRKNSPGQAEQQQQSEFPVIKPPRNPKKSPKIGKVKESPREKMDPVTLNLILREELNVLTNGFVTRENIVQALEITRRPINKRAVYRDLETILAHEIHLGYLVKHTEKTFILARINKDKHYRGTIPLKCSKRKPKPTQRYLEMEADMRGNKPEKYSEYETFDQEGNFPIKFSNGVRIVKSEEELKDDLIKEKLINSNLLKMKSKMKSGKVKVKKENNSPCPGVEILPVIVPALVETLKMEPDVKMEPEDIQVRVQDQKKPLLVPIKPKLKKEAWQVSITVKEAKPRPVTSDPGHTQVEIKEEKEETLVEEITIVKNEDVSMEDASVDELSLERLGEESWESKPKRSSRKRKMYSEDSEEETMPDLVPPSLEVTTRTSSGRTKRARKIFDPADHDVPSRIMKKCRTNSPSQDPTAISNPEKPGNRSESPKCSQEIKPDQNSTITQNTVKDVDPVPQVPVSRSAVSQGRRSSTGKQTNPTETQSKVGARKSMTKPEAVKPCWEKIGSISESVSEKQMPESNHIKKEEKIYKKDALNKPLTEGKNDMITGNQAVKEVENEVIRPSKKDGKNEVFSGKKDGIQSGKNDESDITPAKKGTLSCKKEGIEKTRTGKKDGAGVITSGKKDGLERNQPVKKDLLTDALSGKKGGASTPGKNGGLIGSTSGKNGTPNSSNKDGLIINSPFSEDLDNLVPGKRRIDRLQRSDIKISKKTVTGPRPILPKAKTSADERPYPEDEPTSLLSFISDDFHAGRKAESARKVPPPVLKIPTVKKSVFKGQKELSTDQERNVSVSMTGDRKEEEVLENGAKKKSAESLDPTFKVPAPKKYPSKLTPPERTALLSKHGKVKHPAGKGEKPKSPVASRATRAGSLNLRAKKDPRERALCMNCNTGNKKNEKLIFCKDCDKILHPSCLQYPEDLTDRIYKQPWQCIDCKTCYVCVKSGDDDKMLFCDSCDLGYHMTCHRPAISRKPRGRWECDSCAAETGYKGETDEKFNPPGAATYFEELLPNLPPGVGPWPVLGFSGAFCPAPDQYPSRWQDLPIDESIPDISGWSPARMSQYLVQNGIKDVAAKVFFEQEIDGASALVLQRRDVLQGLGLKLGPALKIYHHIKRLQTRRNFGLVA